MIFYLPQLDRIHCSVKASLLSPFQSVLEEGRCYRIDKLNVGINDSKFHTTQHKYKLNFMNVTSCCTIECDDIPLQHFLFTPFHDILAAPKDDLIVGLYLFGICKLNIILSIGSFNSFLFFYLADVIGHVIEKGEMKETCTNDKVFKLVNLVLEDLEYV